MKFEKCLKTTSKKALHRFTALAAVLLAVCLVFMTPVSAADTIPISSAEDLKKIGKEAGHPLDGSYILTDNINLNNEEWTPIGDMPNMFTGTFDGNGKTISGLSITSSNQMFVGLFGASTGTVKNLHVSGKIDITSSSSLSAGIIAGMSVGTISSCYSSGSVNVTITGSEDETAAVAGGIAGVNMDTISDCYSTGTVKAVGGIESNAGGIVGTNQVTISNCYALNEEIIATGQTVNAGRIAGLNKGNSPQIVNSFGWVGMKVNNNLITDGTASDTDGEFIYAKSIWENLYPPLKPKAAYLEPKLTLTYNKNEGEGTEPTATYAGFAKGEWDKVQSSNSLTKEGSYFAGWNTNQNGGGTNYVQGQTISIEDNITLYANWTTAEVESYKVTFNSNGGAEVPEQNVLAGGYVIDPELTREGYTLVAWKKDGTEWDFDSNTVNEAITLTAEWKINQYKISFHGILENAPDTIKQDYGTTVTKPANPTRDGHTFAGWNPEIPATMPAQDTMVYVQWTINQYTISFENTGDTTIAPITQDYGTTVTKPADPSWIGHTFSGWDKEIPSKIPAENLIINATWTLNNYTVKYHANGGSGTMADQEFEYGVTEVLNASTFTAPSGKVFNGWNTKVDGSGTAYSAGYSASKITTEDNVVVDLYAQWKYPSSGGSSKPTYTVTFNANGGAGEMFPQTFTSGKEKALNLNFFTKEGYTFAGWATSADGDVVYTDGETIKVSKSMTLYAVWESNEPVNPQQPGDNPEQPGDEPENPEKPTEPETPAPILAVLAGLGAAVVLRRK